MSKVRNIVWNMFDELEIDNELHDWNTFYILPIRSREQNEYVGNCLQLVDTNYGFRTKGWVYDDY